MMARVRTLTALFLLIAALSLVLSAPLASTTDERAIDAGIKNVR